ncbi:Gfo/Idh/MocA family oxidoreductase [Amylibacter sp. SFDW26]|uniref:Gfo/Idh/MocA family protein n=1 Tax=Amylibacter sp. SFDW26 TaxID=2652722 RepID=UPI00126155DB|nr:Gfo/Idh/MocA family oxidoreductase [Amylibacter sp. SFDW26]KAB7615213.1 Gfo/Idh/MocA family oxidoreductase [Amylibacter sp. SFDW26]
MIEPDVRVACLGAGYFSQFHYDAWRRIDRVALVGSADTDYEKAAETGAPAFSDYEKMLSVTLPDVLDIITPPPTHIDAIKTAIVAGVKTIICQKPFCMSLDEAKEAVQLAHDADVQIIVHENFRFQPWYRLIAEQIKSGVLGEVQQVTFRLRTGDGQGPEAYLDRQPYFQTMKQLLVHETAVHWIDTFQYLLGPVQSVYADLRRLNPVIAGEDAGYILFDFENGARALFDGNRHLDHAAKNHRMTLGEALVEGTKGTITLAGDGSVQKRSFGDIQATTILETQDWAGFAGDCVYALQNHVISGLLNATPLENTAAEYLSVIEIEQAIYRSAQEHRKLEL